MTIEKPEPSFIFLLKVSFALILARILLLVLLPPIPTSNSNLTWKQGMGRAPMLISTRNLIEFDNQFINFLVRFTGVYYVHFEITGGPGRRDLFTHRTIVCSKSHLFRVNEKAFLKRNNQSDFMFKVTNQIATK